MRPPIPDLFTRVGIVLPDHIAPRRPGAAPAGVPGDPGAGAGRPDRRGPGAEIPDAVPELLPGERGHALPAAGDRDG
ncbi:hypothetical protein ACU4GA_24225 [Methylobacterium oryzae CBMB20]